ncbi:hypothetical protein N0V93_004627 [Gnomoniopsis smithogilvyi]|uniref:DUF2306 domain-containing protein n=1 Tax=Gnomoniopsis smithogilvyi TaxID=1191159 RepID=A0A9W8YRT8_9PEZI|nr:hypothetical protein N0V93_004627 [Gnomoniopsis smithogilvyi]
MNSTTTLVGVHRRAQKGQSNSASSEHKPANVSLVNSVRSVNKSALTWKWYLMTVAAFIVAGWTFHFIYHQPPGMDGYVDIRNRILGNPLGFAHVFGGGTAMALGPFQFIRSLRSQGKTSPRFSTHSWVGRIYTLAVLASGVGSIDIVKKSDLYTFGAVGFIMLGLSWLVTGTLGWLAMWKGTPDIDSHKKWMIRNFALTYAAVMLRWQFPLMIILGTEVKLALSWSGWCCWVPNLLFVNYWVLKTQK